MRPNTPSEREIARRVREATGEEVIVRLAGEPTPDELERIATEAIRMARERRELGRGRAMN